MEDGKHAADIETEWSNVDDAMHELSLLQVPNTKQIRGHFECKRGREAGAPGNDWLLLA